MQSKRATEQTVAEQSAGHMTRALLPHASLLAAGCDVRALSHGDCFISSILHLNLEIWTTQIQL
jgi:hypothetical protein